MIIPKGVSGAAARGGTKTAITLRNIKFNVEEVSKITEFRKTGIRGETIRYRQYQLG
jgi:hypothetical protein